MPVEKNLRPPSEAFLVSLNFRHVDARFEVFRLGSQAKKSTYLFA